MLLNYDVTYDLNLIDIVYVNRSCYIYDIQIYIRYTNVIIFHFFLALFIVHIIIYITRCVIHTNIFIFHVYI